MFLPTFGHEKWVICVKLEHALELCYFWSKMFPSYPKCSPGTPAVPVLFFMSVSAQGFLLLIPAFGAVSGLSPPAVTTLFLSAASGWHMGANTLVSF